MTTRSLENIKVSGFKSIRQLDLDLHSINVLIGANGSGKSNFISVFKFLNQIINHNLQLYTAQQGGANQLLHYGSQTTSAVRLELRFSSSESDNANGYYCVLLPTAQENFVFGNEGAYYHNKTEYDEPYRRSLGKAHSESQLVAPDNTYPFLNYVIEDLRSWRIYHFHDTSDTAKVKAFGDIHDNIFLRPDGSNLAAYLYMLRETQNQYYRNIVDTIRLVAPFFDDFVLRPAPMNVNTIRLEWQEKGADDLFGPNILSDGTLRFISLAALFMQPPDKLPATILLDEPELGLHPYAIALLADMIRSVSSAAQVIVATQSVTLVNQFDVEDIIVVDRIGGQSTFQRLNPLDMEHWIEDYGLGDLWEKNVLRGRPA